VGVRTGVSGRGPGLSTRDVREYLVEKAEGAAGEGQGAR